MERFYLFRDYSFIHRERMPRDDPESPLFVERNRQLIVGRRPEVDSFDPVFPQIVEVGQEQPGADSAATEALREVHVQMGGIVLGRLFHEFMPPRAPQISPHG